jgi:hypothetical protein
VTGDTEDLFYISGEYDPNDILTFTPKPHAVGSTKLTLWLEDSMGFTDFQDLWVELTPVNDRPFIKLIPDLHLKKNVEYQFDFKPYINDIDNDISDLTLYTFSAMGQNHITLDGFTATINYPESFDKFQDIITITVEDGLDFSDDLFIINFGPNTPPDLDPNLNLPQIVSFLEDTNFTMLENINNYFIDPDDSKLQFSFVSKYIQATLNENSLDITNKIPNWFGTDTLMIRASDSQNGFKEVAVQVTVEPFNDPPVISTLPEINVHHDSNFEFDVSPFIYDVDNATSDLTIRTSDTTNLKLTELKPHVIIINYSKSMAGFELHINVSVSDGMSESSQTLIIFVSDNLPPQQLKSLKPVQFIEDKRLIDHFNLNDYFVDPDGNKLVYRVTNETIQVDIDEEGFVDFSAPLNWYGTEKVIFIVRDLKNATYCSKIDVLVIPENDKPVLKEIPNQVGKVDSLWVLDLRHYVSDVDNEFEELEFTFEEPKGYAILHGSSILFNYASVKTEALTVEASDGKDLSSTSFVVEFIGSTVDASKKSSEDSGFQIFMAIMYILILIITINGGLIAYTYVKYKGKFKLEDLFLIHANGNLISHIGGGTRVYADNELLGGMLTAIQDFIKDGFSGRSEGSDDEWGLDHLKFGEHNIFIVRGDYMYIAAVFKGEIGWKLRNELKAVLKEIDTNYSKILKDWTGLVDGLDGINVILEKKYEMFAPKETRKTFKRGEEPDDSRIIFDDTDEPTIKMSDIPEFRKPSDIPDQESDVIFEDQTFSGKPPQALAPATPSQPAGALPVGTAIPAAPEAQVIPEHSNAEDTSLSYAVGSKPNIPRSLTDGEKVKLQRTKPINNEFDTIQEEEN